MLAHFWFGRHFDFWCTLPSYGSPNHSRGIHFQPTMWGPRVFTWEGFHLRNEAVVFGGPLILVSPVLGLHIYSDQLENEATPYFTLVATLKSSFSLSFLLWIGWKVGGTNRKEVHFQTPNYLFLLLCEFALGHALCVKTAKPSKYLSPLLEYHKFIHVRKEAAANLQGKYHPA